MSVPEQPQPLEFEEFLALRKPTLEKLLARLRYCQSLRSWRMVPARAEGVSETVAMAAAIAAAVGDKTDKDFLNALMVLVS